MLLRPAGHRAVQRQLHPPLDTIWISDEALQQAYQRFSRGSKVCKRHGSFVPGPLESRRRLGKRRMTMTLQPDASSIPAFDPGWFRGWFGPGERDRTQWQWEAPYTRVPTLYVEEPALPPWLAELESTSSLYAAEAPKTVHRPRDTRTQQPLSFQVQEVAAFCLELETSPGTNDAVCDAFIQHIRRSLVLGIMSEDVLKHILVAVPDIIMHQQGVAVDETRSQCLQLYQAIWEGIESCKVRQAGFLHGKTMKRLFSLVCRLPMTVETQQLGVRLIHAASSTQIIHMKHDLPRFIVTWIEQHVFKFPGREKTTCIPKHQQTVLEVHLKIKHIHRLYKEAVYRGKDRSHYTEQLLLCQEAKRFLRSALDDIQGEELSRTRIAMPASLLNLLKVVPGDVVCGVLRAGLHYIVNNSLGLEKTKNQAMQFALLLLAAQTPAVVDMQFEAMLKVKTCQLKPSQFSRLLFDQWTSQGHLKVPSITRNTWQILMASGIPPDAALFHSFYKNRELFGERLRHGILLWHKLSMRQSTFRVVLELLRAHIQIPPFLMNLVLESVSTFSAHKAYELYTLYLQKPAVSNRREYYQQALRLEYCPKFVAALINEPRFKTDVIWRMVGMKHGLHEQKQAKKSLLHYRSVEMVTRMAIAFAHSPRPTRVAFRQVSACARYLQNNQLHITSDITRSLVLSGITNKIREGKYVPECRKEWIWGLVRQAEGDEVAKRSAAAVKLWNGKIQSDQIAAKAQRENWNRLDVGPID